MSETREILTAEKFLERKKIIDENHAKQLTYYSELLGGNIDIDANVDVSEITDLINQQELSESERYVRLVYTCCPIFKAPEFRNAYDIKEPYDVVRESFKGLGVTLFELGNQILTVYGFMDDKKVDELKK